VAKDKKAAEQVFRDVIERDPNKMVGRFDLGRLLVEEGRITEAREIWNGRTSDKDNTFPNFIVLLERADKKKAAEDNLAKNPNSPEALLQMGLMVMDGESWVVDGRQEKAILFFQKALGVKPDYADAQYAICQAYVQMADTYKAKNKETDQEIAKLRKMDPKLADRITEYRKTYSGGLKAGPSTINQ
jgi:cytochrome c-type biogenesis protein CcmH/NrfG